MGGKPKEKMKKETDKKNERKREKRMANGKRSGKGNGKKKTDRIKYECLAAALAQPKKGIRLLSPFKITAV